jgi:hypothetical protein
MTAAACLLTPFILTYFLVRNKKKVINKEYDHKFGEVVTSLNLKHKGAFYYYAVFMFKRAAFVAIVVFMYDYPGN